MQTEIFPELTADLKRAGFWRRFWSTVLDWLIVYIPLMIVAALLFNATGGKVQMASSVQTYCTSVSQIPATLSPPPPHDHNFAVRCEKSLFGVRIGESLTVGRKTSDGTSTRTISYGYMLDANGQPVDGFSLDWIVQLALLIYLIALTVSRGQTLGNRILKIRVVDISMPGPSHVPLRKAILRYVAMAIGFVPSIGISIYLLTKVGTDSDAAAATISSFVVWLRLAGVLAFVWTIVQIILIAMKRDPLYDRIAGTAVVRQSQPAFASVY